jgi:hypothetical protein
MTNLFGRQFLLILFLLCAMPTHARAQQPFATDDADVTAKGKLHFEFSNEYDLLQRSLFPSRAQNTADAELDYGLLKGVEVGVESPLITITDARGPAAFGVGDTNLSVKYKFHKEREGSRWPALAASLNVELPTGDPARQLGSGLTDVWLYGVAQKSLSDRTKLRVNAGLLFAGNTTTGVIGIKTRGRVYTGAGSVVCQFTRRLDLGAEIFGAVSANFRLNRGQLQTQVGGNYALGKNVTLDFGLTVGRFSASPRLGVQLGFSKDF